MKNKFDTLVNFIIDHLEKGYVNNPNDPGGETKFGISKRSYPHIDIKTLTKAKAKNIYYEDFYDEVCEMLPIQTAFIYFDCCILHGKKAAVKLLQESLNDIYFVELVEDGIFGPITRSKLQLNAGACFDCEVSAMMQLNRLKYIKGLKNFHKFGNGWFNRCFKTKDFVIKLKYINYRLGE